LVDGFTFPLGRKTMVSVTTTITPGPVIFWPLETISAGSPGRKKFAGGYVSKFLPKTYDFI